MKHLALTGGIGSGKSTVAQMFVDHGATLIDADAISREQMTPGHEVLEAVVAEFGESILDENGELNRPALAEIVFADDEARHKLNTITHPAIRAESARRLETARQADPDGAIVIQDIPLLVETGQAENFPDGVIVVQAPEDVRLDRLVSARGMNADDARSRIASQASDEQRQAIATWLINNAGDLESTREQVEKIWAELH